MSVDDPFAEAQALHEDAKCPVYHLQKQLEDEDPSKLESLQAALSRPKKELFGTVIAEVVRSWGFGVSDEAMQRHRRGACGCES